MQNIDWVQIKLDYQNNNQSVAKICSSHGITKNQLYKYVRANNWPLRTTVKPATPTTTLQEALEYIAMELMQRIQQSATLSSADHDKDARTLSSLVRTYEKLKDIKQANAQSSNENEQTNNKGTSVTHEDTDSQRRQLAASLEKLIKGL